MDTFTLTGPVERFPGPKGWYYVALPDDLEAVFRPLVRARWPGLIRVRATVGSTTWSGSMMPIKGGPLFLSLPAKVRKSEAIDVGQVVIIECGLRA